MWQQRTEEELYQLVPAIEDTNHDGLYNTLESKHGRYLLDTQVPRRSKHKLLDFHSFEEHEDNLLLDLHVFGSK